MQQQISGRTKLLRWTGLLVVSAILFGILELAHLPAALLLGPMLAAIAFAATEKTVHVSNRLVSIAQAMIGCMIAKSIPLSIFGEMARDWPIFLAGVVSVIAAAVTLGWLLARFHVLPGTTAIWGAMPGGASAMVIMSESFGADMRLVAFMQYLRIVCVAIAASTISRIWVSKTGVPLPQTIWFPSIEWLPMAETAALIAGCILLTKWFRIPAGIFLLPLILGVILQNTGIVHIELPPWLLAASYALVGWTIGGRFSRDILAHAMRALPQVIGSILALIAICGGFAVILVYVADVDPLTAYLATSPGGADSVAIISASSHVDVPFVMSMQLARLLMILLTGPALARLVVKWSRLSDEPRESGKRSADSPPVDAK
ncbi:MAG: rane protein AbrB duplication [Rhizobium sp.]|nr:rane protein AbrB duplication [Rhizobium sp.]